MVIGIRVLFSYFVGEDEFSNRYYIDKFGNTNSKPSRWIRYNGKIPDPSKIPPDWHAWIHYTTDIVGISKSVEKYPWFKKHLPNLTGTKHAYFPKGHIKGGGARDISVGDYKAWSPNNE